MSNRIFLVLFFYWFFISLSAEADQDSGSPDYSNQLLYSVWESEATAFGFPDSTLQSAKKSVDGCFEKMFSGYLVKNDAKSLQRRFPEIGLLTDAWQSPYRDKLSFEKFKSVVSSAISEKYSRTGTQSLQRAKMLDLEKEIVFWIGDFIKNNSIYSEKVYAYYYKNESNKAVKVEDQETSLHTLLAGRDGNPDRRRYNCESFSKGMVLIAALVGLKPEVVSVITVLKDHKGKKVNQLIVENGQNKEIGHVCNLLTLSNGKRIYYDQGIAMDPRYEHQIVVAYDNKGNSFELYSSNDSLWTSEPSILGQTVSDMDELNRIDKYLTEIEDYISDHVELLYTEPEQTKKMKEQYARLLSELKKVPYRHIRVIATDIVKEKIKATQYELQYQIDQLDNATGKLTAQKKENQKIKEFNNAINQYNLHNDRYRVLVDQYKNDLPRLKAELARFRKECLAQRDQFSLQKGFMGKTVQSSDGRVLRFAVVVEQYNQLIGNIDYILGLPEEVKYLNLK